MCQKMKQRHLLRTLISIVLLCALLCGTTVIPYGNVAAATAKYNELKEKKSEIQKRIADNEEKLKKADEELNKQEEKLDAIQALIDDYNAKIDVLKESIKTLNEQIDGINAEIQTINDEIEDVNRQIDAYNVEIEGKEADIQATVDLLKDRLKASYMAGNVSDIEILIGASNLTSFLTRLEIFERDINALEALKEACNASIALKQEKIAAKEAKRLEVEKSKQAVEADIAEQNAAKKKVDKSYEEAYQIANSIKEESASYKKAIAYLIDDEARIQRQMEEEIQAYYRQQAENSGKSGDHDSTPIVMDSGEWGFPLRSRSGVRVTSGFGSRTNPVTGKAEIHKGIDMITSASDKTVIASRAGRVYRAGYDYSRGNFVIIDHGTDSHGDKYMTVYMHFAQPAYVREGQSVSRGQAIGYMGKTGCATGVHLHFQIEKNGSPVNPRPYIGI